MSITVSIYDLFAYTIPGILYLFTFNELARALGVAHFDIAQIQSWQSLLLLAIVAYISGQIMDQICNRVWVRLWYRKSAPERAFDDLQRRYPNKANFKPTQWSILFTILRHEDHPTADTVDRIIATSIMFRNISFGLLLFGVLEFYYAFRFVFSLPDLLFAVVVFLASIVSMRRNNYFSLMSYSIIFQHAFLYKEEIDRLLGNASNLKPKPKGRKRREVSE